MQTEILVLIALVAPVVGPIAIVVSKKRLLLVLLRFFLRFERAT